MKPPASGTYKALVPYSHRLGARKWIKLSEGAVAGVEEAEEPEAPNESGSSDSDSDPGSAGEGEAKHAMKQAAQG